MSLDILITGASRGIGLELASQALQRGDRVFAACRNPGLSPGLQELGRVHGTALHALQVDVADEETILKASWQVERVAGKLDILINNAAEQVDRTERIDNLQQAAMLNSFKVNAIGPFLMVKNFLGLIKKGSGKKIVNISSEAGALQGIKAFKKFYSYAASKAAQNMMSILLSHELKEENVVVVALHPGSVHTKEVNRKAPTEPPEAVQAIYAVIDQLTIEDTGKFFNSRHEEMTW